MGFHKTVSEYGLRVDLRNSQGFVWQIPWQRGLFEWEKELQNQVEKLINTDV